MPKYGKAPMKPIRGGSKPPQHKMPDGEMMPGKHHPKSKGKGK